MQIQKLLVRPCKGFPIPAAVMHLLQITEHLSISQYTCGINFTSMFLIFIMQTCVIELCYKQYRMVQGSNTVNTVCSTQRGRKEM